MKILFLSTWLPYPLNHGNRIRTYYLLRELSRHHEITLLSFIQDPSERQYLSNLEKLCRRVMTVEHDPFAARSFRVLLSYFVLQPKFLFAGYSHKMAALLNQEVDSGAHDALICEVMVAASYGKDIHSIPTIYDDLELGQFLDGQSSHNLLRDARRFLSHKILKRYLRNMVEAFDLSTVPSRIEQDIVTSFLHCDRGKLPILPNGVDVQNYRSAPPIDTGKPYLVFNGALTFSANYEAMDFFLKEIWPLVRTQFPNLEIRITGSLKGVDMQRLPVTPGVVFTGYLEDVRPTVAAAKVCVAPILTGGGTRLKVLEAMALGVPVVATPKAVEGLDVVPEKHVWVADSARDFARAISLLLSNEALRVETAQAARELVARRYDWRIIGQRLEQILQQFV